MPRKFQKVVWKGYYKEVAGCMPIDTPDVDEECVSTTKKFTEAVLKQTTCQVVVSTQTDEGVLVSKSDVMTDRK